MPVLLPPIGAIVQVGPDGRRWSARGSGHGWARLARITAEVGAAPTLAGWFPTGSCYGMLSEGLTGFLRPAIREELQA